MKAILIALVGVLVLSQTASAQTREDFTLGGLSAFVITPNTPAAGNPWIAYAPAVGGLPSWTGGGAEAWMFNQYFAAGIAVAGIYAGDLSGNPAQRAGYTDLYNELVGNRGYAAKFSFHTRSRGGLLGYNWAADNPDKVAAIGGIYSVTNLLSYPGAGTAASHYGITVNELTTNGHLYNPIERLAGLVANDISVFHIHGDNDSVVPIEDNTQIVKDYFDANGGDATLTVIPGGGHDMSAHWWNNQPLTDFMIAQTLAAPQQNPFVQVNQQTGEIKIINPADGNADMDLEDYSLTSATGALDPSSWTPIAGNYDLAGDDSVDDDGNWTVLTSTNAQLSEEAQAGGDDGLIAIDTEVSLGAGAWVQNPTKDLQFAYTDTGGAAKSLLVKYVGDDIPVGDLDFDGLVDASDWPIFNSAGLTDLSGLSAAEAYQMGDLDGDFDNDVHDFVLFRAAYEAAHPAPGAFEAMLASFNVPEPGSLLLLGAGAVGLTIRRRKRACTSRAAAVLAVGVVAMAGLFVTTPADAQTTITVDSNLIDWNRSTATQAYVGGDTWAGLDAVDLPATGTYTESVTARGLETGAAAAGMGATSDIDDGIGDGISFFRRTFTLPSFSSVSAQVQFADNNFGQIFINGIEVASDLSFSGSNWTAPYPKFTVAADGTTTNVQKFEELVPNFSGWQVGTNELVVALRQRAGGGFALRMDLELPPNPLTLHVNTTSGAMAMLGHPTQAVDINSYEIASAGGLSLDDVGWSSLEDQNAPGFPAGNGTGNGWEELGGVGPHALSERYLLGDSTVGAGATVGLGAGYDENVDARDLAFVYSTSAGEVVTGDIEYFSPLLGDTDNDGDVDNADIGATAGNFTGAGGAGMFWEDGDFDGDGDVDNADIGIAAGGFTGSLASSSADRVTTIPEPASLALLGLGGAWIGRRRRR